MPTKSFSQVWFAEDIKQWFLIPCDAVIRPGLDIIYDFEGNKKFVSLDEIVIYNHPSEIIKEYLFQAWQMSLKESRQAWLNLYNFSQKTGVEIDFCELDKQFQEGLEISGPQAEEIFAVGKEFVESITAAAQNSEKLSEDEHKAAFKRVFSQLPQLLEQFSDANLEAAVQDPEEWADRLYQQVFAELDKEKTEQHKRRLTKDIRTSIAERLRTAGVSPSVDWQNPIDPER